MVHVRRAGHFALTRLIAAFSGNRDLRGIEAYGVAIWIYLTTACFIGFALPWIAAIPLALVVIQIPMLSGAGAKANGAIVMLLQFLASAYFAASSGLAHYVALLFITILFMNSAAWILNRWLGI